MFQEDEINFSLILVVGTFAFLVFVISFFILLRGYQIRQLKYLQEKESLKSQFAQALLQSQLEIQEQTLKNISQEIHDNIGQALSLVKLNLNTMAIENMAQVQQKILPQRN